MARIAVLMTCFNRRAKTLAGLEALFATRIPHGFGLEVFLVDDGSTDGTSDAVKKSFPSVKVISGVSGLYWNRGMHLAWSHALPDAYDYYLLLNDDTLLYSDAIETLLETERICHRRGMAGIIAGSTQDPLSGAVTYGGLVRPTHWRPTHTRLLSPQSTPLRADTINGNCILVSNEAVRVIGILDPAFEHAMGDFDYGLRASQAGIPIWVASAFVGVCARNSRSGTFTDTSLPFADRWRLIRSPKGLPVYSWLRFTRRHAGPLWPLVFAWPYVRTVLSSLVHLRIWG